MFPEDVEGAIPLKLYYSEDRRDNFTLATSEAEADAIAAGYRYVRIEGYVYPAGTTGQRTKSLKLYWSEARGDNFLLSSKASEEAALEAGYVFVRIERRRRSP